LHQVDAVCVLERRVQRDAVLALAGRMDGHLPLYLRQAKRPPTGVLLFTGRRLLAEHLARHHAAQAASTSRRLAALKELLG